MNVGKRIALLLMSLSLFACSTTIVNSMASETITLSQIQKEWQLVRIDGQAINPEINSTLNVAAQARATGKLVCNTFFGQLTLKDNTLKITPLASTRMICPEAINDVETIVSSVLKNWSEMQLAAGKLTLSGKIHTLTYRAN